MTGILRAESVCQKKIINDEEVSIQRAQLVGKEIIVVEKGIVLKINIRSPHRCH